MTALTESTARAARHGRLFGVALLACVLVAALDLPWRLSGIGFGVLTVYSGARLLADLNALRRAGRPVPGRIGVIIGICLTSLMTVVLLGQAALYPLIAQQERCLAGAITHQDRQQCQVEFDRRQKDLLHRLRQAAASRP